MILNIKAERSRLGMTRTQLASKLGVCYDAVRKMEAPEWSPSLRTLERVARALGLKVACVPDVAPALSTCTLMGNHGEWCRLMLGHVGVCSWAL